MVNKVESTSVSKYENNNLLVGTDYKFKVFGIQNLNIPGYVLTSIPPFLFEADNISDSFVDSYDEIETSIPDNDEIINKRLQVQNNVADNVNLRLTQFIKSEQPLTGDYFTFSFWGESDVAQNLQIGIRVLCGRGSVNSDEYELKGQTLLSIPAATFGRYHCTFKMPDLSNFILMDDIKAQFFIKFEDNKTFNMRFNKMQLEPGMISNKMEAESEEKALELSNFYYYDIRNSIDVTLVRTSDSLNFDGAKVLVQGHPCANYVPNSGTVSSSGVVGSLRKNGSVDVNTGFSLLARSRTSGLFNIGALQGVGEYLTGRRYFDAVQRPLVKNPNIDSPYLVDSTNIKDIEILKYPNPVTKKDDIVLIGWKYVNGVETFYGWYLEDGYLVDEFPVTYPAPPVPGDHRLAPCFRIKNGTLYSYHSRGSSIMSDNTMRMYYATILLSSINHDYRGRITSINYTNEQELLLLSDGNFAGSTQYAIIDPFLYEDNDGTLYMYYVVVLYGITGVRPNEEFIRVQRMWNMTTPFGQSDDTAVYNGLANNTSDGVAEAQNIVRNKSGKYVMLFSEYGAGWIDGTNPGDLGGQFICTVSADSPKGPWGNREVVFARDTGAYKDNSQLNPIYGLDDSKAKFGIGGQGFIDNGNFTYTMVFQGLVDNDTGSSSPRMYKLFMNSDQLTAHINSKI